MHFRGFTGDDANELFAGSLALETTPSTVGREAAERAVQVPERIASDFTEFERAAAPLILPAHLKPQPQSRGRRLLNRAKSTTRDAIATARRGAAARIQARLHLADDEATRVARRILHASGIFDADFYSSQLAAPASDPIGHYLTVGWRDDMSPAPLFHPRWYRNSYMEPKEGEQAPLLHYLTKGWQRKADPHPLFLSSFYAEQVPDFNLDRSCALVDFMVRGWRLGIAPTPLFDSQFYRENYPDLWSMNLPLIVHYLKHGWREDRRPHPLFDPAFYRREAGSALAHDQDPLTHFAEIGASVGLNPAREFSIIRYGDSNPDLRSAGINLLAHYLQYGAAEGRRAFPTNPRWPALTPNRPPPVGVRTPIPVDGGWDTVCPRQLETPHGVDVIIPVYKGKEETLNCILSVLKARTAIPYRLVVVNDCSPDADLQRSLAALSAQGKFLYRENEKNLGFVRTCNRAMSESIENDVVLLNSDTVVYDGWLDRLVRAGSVDPRIGTVTPLSNNATICSYPFFPHDFPEDLEISHAELDRLTSSANSGRLVDIPTGVGFCLLIKRQVLKEVGPLDAEKYGHGYGEENDLCLRAAERGWRNVLAADVFVTHLGSTSFGDSRNERVAHALRTLARDYPSYDRSIQRFLAADPGWEARFALDLARARRGLANRVFLFVCHSRGGGTERHMRDLEANLALEGASVVFLRPAPNGLSGFSLEAPGIKPGTTPALDSISCESSIHLAAALDALRISHVHIHSLVDFSPRAIVELHALLRTRAIPYDCTVHDYAPVCPRINMIDDSGFFCYEPPPSTCNTCIKRAPNLSWRPNNIESWRGLNREIFAGARKVFAPSIDAANRIRRYFPDRTILVKRHPVSQVGGASASLRPHLPAQSVVRIGIIGAIGLHKGAHLLHNCIVDAAKRKLNLHFTIFGTFGGGGDITRYSNVTVTGPYQEGELPDLLREHPVEFSFFPSLCPETFSYTLSAALTARIYPVAFDMGAIAERIREIQWGELLDFSLARDPSALNDRFRALSIPPQPSEEWRLESDFISYESYTAEYYGLS